MNASARIAIAALLLSATMWAGCSNHKGPAPFEPAQQYPGWAYDAPFYYRPAGELQPQPRLRPDDPLHYFVNRQTVLIKRPGGHDPRKAPRIAVYYTDNAGYLWQKAGYFGIEQMHFALPVDSDGEYGIRFLGPGQPEAKTIPARPERVYHVDTTPPVVALYIEPAQQWYEVNQVITLHWSASDYHLIDRPVQLSTCFDYDPRRPIWATIKKRLGATGSLEVLIPPHSAGTGMQFLAEAYDKAGNRGIAVSAIVQVTDPDAAPATQPAAGPPAATQPSPLVPTEPARPSYPTLQKSAAPPSEPAPTAPPESPAVGRAAPRAAEPRGATVWSPTQEAASSTVTQGRAVAPAEPPRAPRRLCGAHPWQALSPGAHRRSPAVWRLPAEPALPAAVTIQLAARTH